MNPTNSGDENASKIDWIGLVRTYGRAALTIAVGVAVVAAVAGAVYVRWMQPTQMIASLEFRPTFRGVEELKYPNGLPFAPNDVTDGSIIDQVYDRNNISAVCDREVFRGGFYVEQRSDQSVFLDLEYQARLTEPRITVVERRLLQEEHAAKRRALPLQYRLVFVTPPACSSLAPLLMSKIMAEVLRTWASESETKRGVLSQQAEVLTPATLDANVIGSGGLLLRADLLRTTLQRVILNVGEVGRLPGAMLIRLGPERVTFMEVRGKLMDLVGSKLDPLVMTSGRSMVKESSLWVAETVATAERRQHAAELMAASYQQGLREFSGSFELPGAKRAAGAATGSGSGSDGGGAQTMVPQVDGTFIDRIVEMSTANIRYRQQLTDAMVQAQLEAVAAGERSSYYRRLLQSFSGPAPAEDAKELTARFDAIVAEGKALTKQFNDLYDEFSRVSLRSAGSMYEALKPVAIETSRQVSNRSVLLLVTATFVAMLLLSLGFFALRSRLSRVPR